MQFTLVLFCASHNFLQFITRAILRVALFFIVYHTRYFVQFITRAILRVALFCAVDTRAILRVALFFAVYHLRYSAQCTVLCSFSLAV
ncbi:hypothetical protein PJM48_28960, partial [Mycobacterium kansasii]